MGLVDGTLPTIGDPNATEDVDVRNTLNKLLSEVNGLLDESNIKAATLLNLTPWTIQVMAPITDPATQTNWNKVVVSSGIVGARLESTGAQNAEVGWDIVLGAGTWKFTLVHTTNPDRGIYTVSIDGATVGTVDGYNGVAVDNITSSISGIAVASTGKKRVLLKMATKNGAATSFFGTINAIQLRRTA